MKETKKSQIKQDFLKKLKAFAQTLKKYVSTTENEWTIKGFIDIFENIYTISADTKIIVPNETGKPKYITNLRDYLKFKGKDDNWINKNVASRKTTASIKKNE